MVTVYSSDPGLYDADLERGAACAPTVLETDHDDWEMEYGDGGEGERGNDRIPWINEGVPGRSRVLSPFLLLTVRVAVTECAPMRRWLNKLWLTTDRHARLHANRVLIAQEATVLSPPAGSCEPLFFSPSVKGASLPKRAGKYPVSLDSAGSWCVTRVQILA